MWRVLRDIRTSVEGMSNTSPPTSGSDSTCWMLIAGAAAGRTQDREEFARRYAPVARAYLAHRWKGACLISELDDAVQNVFLECFRKDGVLDRTSQDRPRSFRALLYGVIRNVALRCERRAGQQRRERPSALDPELLPNDDATLSQVFDRAWATSVFRQAGLLQTERAREAGEKALRRVELLSLRTREGLPIREIARRWKMDAATVHKEYARARREFKAALTDTVTFHNPGASPAEIETKCTELLELLKG